MIDLEGLNDKQKEAVIHTEGPLLILAGAGSGKTRVITHRIAYLIDEKGVKPWNILAITFTNKAAAEMRSRVDSIVGMGSEQIWVSTFHSMCVRILRRYIDRIGIDTGFTIYDTDDAKSIVKDIFKNLNLDTKMFKERSFLARISSAKNEMVTAAQFADEATEFMDKKIAQVYIEYDKRLRSNQALDFDDLLLKSVELLKGHEEVRNYYQDRFKYIHVDEYQDTNTVQFQLVKILSEKYRNLCVVGDDDQSIYKFRGANIRNILNFEEVFPDAKVVKLEQNYRSTTNILDAANAVISNNIGRKQKKLWTANGEGRKPRVLQFDNAYEEADFIAVDIRQKVREGLFEYGDHAVLYRTNAQSRILEEKFVNLGIPYKIIGGVNFYSRKEIKDVLAYLKTIAQAKDDLAVQRILNVPKRGIGQTTTDRITAYAAEKGITFYEALRNADSISGISRGLSNIKAFVALIEGFRELSKSVSPSALLDEVIRKTGIEKMLAEDENAEDRIANVEELQNKLLSYEDLCEKVEKQPNLVEFLEEVALVADIDGLDSDNNYVVLMTLHNAKGLEFPRVVISGMEDGLFPSYMSIVDGGDDEIEEERRLCYVGITRAKQELTLTWARTRMSRGELVVSAPSRFLREIPSNLLDGKADRRSKYDDVMGDYKPSATQFNNSRGGYLGMDSGETGYNQENKSVAKRPGLNSQAKQTFQTKAFSVKEPLRQGGIAKTGLNYGEGDRVKSARFGEGTVITLEKMEKDYRVTVEFDDAGKKVMLAGFAKLSKI
ncbi:MAG: UvrD-helicase domain-containing protein [Lachnospiraceae bacterium]|nr:UvrD-helicase domain-containing protein [Lachnospiraceae bacterium]